MSWLETEKSEQIRADESEGIPGFTAALNTKAEEEK